jgi:surface antigen
MNPLGAFKYVGLRNELKIILGVITFLLIMPFMAVFGLTKVKTVSEAGQVYNLNNYPGDYYAWGNCTWWVSMRRSQIGEPIPNSWGNAATWAVRAANDGYTVDHTPSFGAIMQISNVDHGLGHVAFVESVNSDGIWNISEMNVLGLDVVDDKSMSASSANSYNFIHNVED